MYIPVFTREELLRRIERVNTKIHRTAWDNFAELFVLHEEMKDCYQDLIAHDLNKLDDTEAAE